MSQPKPNTMDDLSLAEFYRREKDELLELLANIVNGAVPMGDQEDGDFVGFYVLSTGQIHKAIPVLDRHKVDRYPATHKVKRFEAFMSAKLQEVDRAAREKRIKDNQSFCGCPMCEHHSAPYRASLKGGDDE